MSYSFFANPEKHKNWWQISERVKGDVISQVAGINSLEDHMASDGSLSCLFFLRTHRYQAFYEL